MSTFLTEPVALGPSSTLLAVGSHADLVHALVARRRKLGFSQRDVDEIAGLPNGYTSQVEMSAAPERAKGARAIGWDSLPKLLLALGLKIAVVDSDAKPCLAAGAPLAAEAETDRPEVQRFLREWGAKGGRIAARRMTAEERSERARRAAQARHGRAREAVAS